MNDIKGLTKEQKKAILIGMALAGLTVGGVVLAVTTKKILELPNNLLDSVFQTGYSDVVSEFAKSFSSKGFDYNEVIDLTTEIISNGYGLTKVVNF